MTKLKFIFLFVLAGFILLWLGSQVWLQGSIRRLVEERGGQALGVKTTVESVDLSLLSGRLEVRRLLVANPEGFRPSSFLDVGQAITEVRIGSLLSDVVEVPSILIQDVSVNIEGDRGRFNYQQILANLQKAAGTAPASSDGGGRRFHVSKLEIRNVHARLNLNAASAGLHGVEVRIPDVTLNDLGSGGQPLPMDRLMRLVVESVMRGVADQGRGQLTRELLTNLWGQLSGEAPAGEGQKKREIQDIVDDLQKALRKPD